MVGFKLLHRERTTGESLPDRLRLFIGIGLPPDVAATVARWQERLGGVAGVRWEPRTRLHVTLRFLGETGAELVAAIAEAMARASALASPLTLRLAAPGGFPTLRRPRALWLGLEGDLEALHALRATLDAGLGAVGVPPDEGALHPHVTVARLRPTVRPADRRRLVESVAAGPPSGRWQVREITLFRSILSRDGARHVALAATRLGGGTSSPRP